MNAPSSSVGATGLRSIAVLTAVRMPDLPDTPTMREAGSPIEMAI